MVLTLGTHPDTDTDAHGRPLYRRIADDLRRQIADGSLGPGEALPSELVLARRFGVSRGTIRQARAALRAEGAIGGSQGKPFAVRGAPLAQPLGELISFTAWAQRVGRVPGARVLALTPDEASVEEADRLALAPGAAVRRLERLRTLDGEPVMIERTVFPAAVGDLLAALDLDRTSVYAELAARGIVAVSARHRIDAIAADEADAAILGVEPGHPLLRVQRRAVDVDGHPVEWSDDRYRGDTVAFEIVNSAAAPALARTFAQGAA